MRRTEPPATRRPRTVPNRASRLHKDAITDNGIVTDTISAGAGSQPSAGAASSPQARPQLVIFDLDGTLTDSAEGIVASFLHALSHVGAPIPEGDLAAQIVGPPMDETFHALDLGKSTDAAIAAFRAEYGTRGWAMNTLFDGIAALLADLDTAGVRLAVATSKLEPTARRILAHFGLDQHFEVIAGASPDGSRKAKEEVLAHALALLQPLPERVLMVGDRSHDVDGAAAHGIDTVVVGWGYGQADFADGLGGTGVQHAATIHELRSALGV
jgi:phosphoglycolate phosphatase